MPTNTNYARHARLVDHMASAVGVDIAEEMIRGRLTFDGFDHAVLSCTGCTQPCACAGWLEQREQQQAGPADTTPDFCRNTALFQQLRDA
ncbi:hypothetical protein GCM10011415_16830 [Salipiger pallidus]|uniref:DUF6455 domain-containing protein n=1 Tax=Salipiger pallidus TaxID=1775170 RepID=A0A8J3EGU6_9RHOB|nr:DUF6455 family protein [Salipiger pallidus]GGG69957.1 hypothetical protein GCM10011415_16830 [Salipiger pallidus]